MWTARLNGAWVAEARSAAVAEKAAREILTEAAKRSMLEPEPHVFTLTWRGPIVAGVDA